jgi:hypothetical protein
MRRTCLLVFILSTILPIAAPAQTTADRVTLDMYLELESVSNPQLSPDGTQIIYTRQWVDKVNDKRESSL